MSFDGPDRRCISVLEQHQGKLCISVYSRCHERAENVATQVTDCGPT